MGIDAQRISASHLTIVVGHVGGAGRKLIFVVVRVKVSGDGELADGIFAGDALGFFFAAGQCAEQQRRQDGDDRDHHEQFDQRKCATVSHKRRTLTM